MFSRGLIISVVLVGLTVESTKAESEWNQATRDLILKIHNDRRRKEGGCHINKLEYDQNLENQARSWAERCVFKHEMVQGRGENLAFNSNKMSEEALIKDGTDAWFNEKNRYSFGQHSCGPSAACHYTQMVWGATNKIGCYSTRCANLTRNTQNAWYLVCFYTPRGNWNGVKPYEKGCSSPCLKGQTENDGLCVGEPLETKNKEVCKDTVENCAMWASNGECDKNPAYMKEQCQKSCKTCVGEPLKTTKNKEVCKDTVEKCPLWASNGECDKNPAYMKEQCQKSCKTCFGESLETKNKEVCKDTVEKCPLWASNGECDKNPAYMKEQCQKSCKICES